jgi:hypothetical protein
MANGQLIEKQLIFKEEVNLLAKYYSPITLSRGEQQVVILPELQGRVMSSTSNGGDAKGYGWFNYEYFEQSKRDQNAAMGGGSRLWFGPDASKFSLFFKPNTKTIPDNIIVPQAVSLTPFNVVSSSNEKVVLTKELSMQNYQGFVFDFSVKREVELLAKSQLPVTISNNVDWVGYQVNTEVINTSNKVWQKSTGLFSIWELGAFYPSNNTTVVIPIGKPLSQATRYFSDVKASHTHIEDNLVFYNADANYMNKIGIPSGHTLPKFGSYDENRRLLTVVTFTITRDEEADYVNGIWQFNGDAFNGEIINVFNDGPDDLGDYFGPFYELETSSKALNLKPKESYQHQHTTMHFQGSEASLNQISVMLLGVQLEKVKTVF